MRFHFIVLLALYFNCSQAQNILRGKEHYAINDSGDTIKGFIEEIGETKITVATILGNEYVVQRLSTKSIKQYIINDTIYRRVLINIKKSQKEGQIWNELGTPVFLKLLIDGSVPLYERNITRLKMMEIGTNVDAKGFLHNVPEKELYLQFAGELPAVLINEKNFYEAAVLAMGNKKRVKERLNTAYYTFENLEQMVMDYNYLVENNLE